MKNIFSIEDVFTITGRGTVATGRIVSGDVSTGNYLVIPDGKKVLITGVEQFAKSFGIKGDNVGLLLRGVTKEYVSGFRRCQVDIIDIVEMRDNKLNQLGI